MIHAKTFLLSGLVVLTTTAGNAFARFQVDAPPATHLHKMAGRQDTPTTTLEPPTSTLSEDPWECVTENITQYFVNLPTPTKSVQDAINSYAADVEAPCLKTATGIDFLSCTISDPKSWCGFTTAAPSSVLAGYSTYLSAVTSFLEANSETISTLSTSCAVAWGNLLPADLEWLKIASAHAACYTNAHAETSGGSNSASSTTQISAATTTSTTKTPTTTTSQGVTARGKVLEGYTLISIGITALLLSFPFQLL